MFKTSFTKCLAVLITTNSKADSCFCILLTLILLAIVGSSQSMTSLRLLIFQLTVRWIIFQGCFEKHNPFVKDHPPFTAFRAVDYGYTRMTIHNKTHLYMEQVSVDKVSDGRSVGWGRERNWSHKLNTPGPGVQKEG